MRQLTALSVLIATLGIADVRAQTPSSPPAYTPVRWNENYSYLRDKPGDDFFDPIKYIPLGPEGWFASLGGQARFRYEYFNNENFGAVQNDEGYFLQRYLLHADLHFGPHVRVFAQGKSALVDDGREAPATARPIDGDHLDLQQLFIDFRLPLDGSDALTLRVGRQDLIYGAQRLISPLDWTNVRRTFDGSKLSLSLGRHTIDAFLVQPVVVEDREFNERNRDVTFGGIYDTINLPQLLPGGNTRLELYALGLWTRTGIDNDIYTLGTRFSSQPKPWDFDVELDYQFGTAGSADISAFSVALEGGYTFANVALTPRLFAGFDYASGDRDPGSGTFRRFNQLFPLGHQYLGFIDVVGRQNIIDVHPGIEFTLLKDHPYARRLGLRIDYHLFWRAETADGLFNAGGQLLRPAGGSDSRFVGSEIDLFLTWQINRHLAAYAGYSRFFAGSFLSDTGPSEDIDFAYVAFTFTF